MFLRNVCLFLFAGEYYSAESGFRRLKCGKTLAGSFVVRRSCVEMRGRRFRTVGYATTALRHFEPSHQQTCCPHMARPASAPSAPLRPSPPLFGRLRPARRPPAMPRCTFVYTLGLKCMEWAVAPQGCNFADFLSV